MPATVQEVMTPNPTTLGPDATVREAARLMRDEDIGNVIVTDGDRVVGIVTDRDIVVRAVVDGKDPASMKLREICTEDPVCVTPDTTVDDAVDKMKDRAVRRLPVVEGGKPVGVVALGDLAIEREDEDAVARISAARPNN